VAPAPAPPIVLSDPYAVFAAARGRWESARYPAQIAYTVKVTVSRRGIASVAHYHSYYDAIANRVNVVAVSDEEIDHPYTPHGINTFFSPFGLHIPLSSPQHTFDYLGVPVLSPNYSFGINTYVPHAADDVNSEDLVRQIRREFNDPAPPRRRVPESAGLKTIASIEVIRRAYVITLDPLTGVGGHTDYHLHLRPLRDPGRYRLRELWVDTRSFVTDKLVTQGNFARGGMTGVPWMIVFRQINGAPYIESEHTDASFIIERHSYDTATVAFESITPYRVSAFMQLSTFTINPQTGVPPLTEPQ
jgi:hypothetical protein